MKCKCMSVIMYKIKDSYNQRSKCTYQPFCSAIEWWKIDMIEFIIVIINRISLNLGRYSLILTPAVNTVFLIDVSCIAKL